MQRSTRNVGKPAGYFDFGNDTLIEYISGQLILTGGTMSPPINILDSLSR